MAKARRSRKNATGGATTAPTAPQTTSALRTDGILGYKIRVLMYDLLNITKDPSSARRLNATVNEHYLSTPYFTASEAETIKNATVDAEISSHLIPDESSATEAILGKSLYGALCALLQNFLDKRRASGDARPCGPHDLAPIFAALLGIELEELKDEKFLGRLRRNGV
ncbi:hypothetical protein VB005_00752 [Metarhizium brunneum]